LKDGLEIGKFRVVSVIKKPFEQRIIAVFITQKGFGKLKKRRRNLGFLNLFFRLRIMSVKFDLRAAKFTES
jgi:hypothetical protein